MKNYMKNHADISAIASRLAMYGNTSSIVDPSTFINEFPAEWKVSYRPITKGWWYLEVEGIVTKTIPSKGVRRDMGFKATLI